MRKLLALVLFLWMTGCNVHAAGQVRPRSTRSAGSALESASHNFGDTEPQGAETGDMKFVDTVYAADAVLFPYFTPLKLEGRHTATPHRRSVPLARVGIYQGWGCRRTYSDAT